MAVEVYSDREGRGDVFVCNTTDTAFGPIMEEGAGDLFLEYLGTDPRAMAPDDLIDAYNDWYGDVFLPQGGHNPVNT